MLNALEQNLVGRIHVDFLRVKSNMMCRAL